MKIKVIVGSTREGRFSEKPADWIFKELEKQPGLEVELLDLKDFNLPFFNSPISPSMIKEPFSDPEVQKWTLKIADGDGFVVVTPEYNHGYPAILKNAFDWVYKEWNKKAIGFVSYGSVGGARSVEQLRQVAAELQMASIRAGIHIQWPSYMEIKQAKPGDSPYTSLEASKDTFIEQLLWWTDALKKARQNSKN